MKVNQKTLIISAFALVLFISDRILKYLAIGEKIFFIKNYNLALSINTSPKLNLFLYFFISLFLFFLIFLLIKCYKNKNFLTTSGCLLIITGAISNLIDRLKFGFIIDYFNFYFFYNNLSDIMICAGIIIITTSVLIKNKFHKNKT